MKKYFVVLLLLPCFSKAQSNKSLSALLEKDWLIMNAINLENSGDTVYNRKANIRRWNLDSTRMYRIANNQLAMIDGEGNIDMGMADSVSSNRFIVHVTYPNGFKCLYEYSDIQVSPNKLSYVFRKWNYIDNSKKRLLHFGYTAVCEPSKKKLTKLTLAQIEKRKKGNKINFEFTYENGQPIADREIKITIPVKGINIVTSVYTDDKGKVTSYFPDSYFATNNHITMFMEYGGLKSSAVLEKKYCPATLKRALTDKEDGTERIGIMGDN